MNSKKLLLTSGTLFLALGKMLAEVPIEDHLDGIPAPIPAEAVPISALPASHAVIPAAVKPPQAALNAFQASTIRPFTVRRAPDSGVVRQMAAGRTRAYNGAPDVAARAFLQDALPLFGPDADPNTLGAPTISRYDWGHQLVYRQQVNGIPVVDHAVTLNLNNAGEVILAENSTEPLPDILTVPGISELRVAGMAGGRLTAGPTLAIRADGLEPRLVWRFAEIDSNEVPICVTVDAGTGHQIERTPLARFATGQGFVYPSNPTRTPTRQMMPLTFLSGTGTLTGDYTMVYLVQQTAGTQTAFNSGLSFNFAPDTQELSQTQAYYGISRFHDWFKGTFNYSGHDHQVPAFVQDAVLSARFTSATTWNSIPTPNGHMVFGIGASSPDYPVRDYALDTDVLGHEYSHAVMQSLNPGFAGASGATNAEIGGVNEGNADYFSTTVLNDPVYGEYVAAASGRPYLRDLTTRLHYPQDVWEPGKVIMDGVTIENVRRRPEIHQTGAIWGAALWDLRTLLGSQKADQIVFKATSLFNETSNFQSALGAILTADDLLYGGVDKLVIRETFQKRGITDSAYPVNYLPYDAFYSATGASKVRLGWPYVGATDGIAYIRPVAPLPSFTVGDNYFFTGYVSDGNINSVAYVLKDADDSVVTWMSMPVRSFNAYGSDGKYYKWLYFFEVSAFPADLIPEGEIKRGGLRLYIHSFVETKAALDANFAAAIPKAIAPAAGEGYSAELVRAQVTPAIFSPSLGDTDGNGKLELRDALLVTRSITGLAALDGAQKTRADIAMPQNGNPDFVDARVILQRAGGLL